MIDPHIHIDSRPREDLAAMAAAGISAVVSMTYYPHIGLPITAQTILDYLERATRFEVWRGKQELIDVYTGVALNPVSIPPDHEKVLAALENYLILPGVVAVGEVGLEPGSQTCPDLARQTEILKEQLKLARKFNKPIVFHTPHQDKAKWVQKYLELTSAEGIAPDKVVVDHADATVLKMITDAGANASITVQPWRGLGPATAAQALKNADLGHILVDSDCNITMPSDALAVPKTALEMRRAGFAGADIKRVVYDNPLRIFSLTMG